LAFSASLNGSVSEGNKEVSGFFSDLI